MSDDTFPIFSIAKAKAHLTEIVRETERGRTVTLTRRGEPVAHLISHAEFRRYLEAKAAVQRPTLYEVIEKWRAETGGIEFTDEELALFERRRDEPPRPNPFLEP